MVHKNTFEGNVVLLIFIFILAETFFMPSSLYTKNLGGFGSVKIVSYTFTFSEIIIFLFIFFYIIFLIAKTIVTTKINLGSKPSVPFILLFLFLFFISVLIGMINSNEELLTHLRTMGYTLSLYVIFLNIKFSNYQKRNIFNLLVVYSIIFTVISFFSFWYPIVYAILPAYFHNYNTLIFAILLFCISFSKIIYEKFSLLWFILTFLSFLTLVIHTFYKSTIFGLFVSILAILLMSYFQSRIKIKLKYIFYIFIIFLFFSILIGQNHGLRNYMIDMAKHRFLNIGRGKYIEEDLSTGRFEIWKNYLIESIKGYGIAPQGFGHETKMEVLNIVYTNKGAHNIIVYFAYHVGFISAICLLILILMFFIKGFRILKNIKYCKNLLFKEYEIVALFSFLISQFAMNMVSLRIMDARYAWMFWFLIVLLIKEWNRLSCNYQN